MRKPADSTYMRVQRTTYLLPLTLLLGLLLGLCLLSFLLLHFSCQRARNLRCAQVPAPWAQRHEPSEGITRTLLLCYQVRCFAGGIPAFGCKDITLLVVIIYSTTNLIVGSAPYRSRVVITPALPCCAAMCSNVCPSW